MFIKFLSPRRFGLFVLASAVQLCPAFAQFTYITNNGSITITGYTGTGGLVSIPPTIDGMPVTTVAPSVLSTDPKPTDVSVPNTVTNIGNFAFGACVNLKAISVDPANPQYRSINGVLFNKAASILILYPAGKLGGYIVPSGVTDVGNNAFQSAASLTNISIAETVTSIGAGAFINCIGLKSVTLPTSLRNVADGTFIGCTELTTVNLPKTLTNIGSHAFQSTGLSNVVIPSATLSIGSAAYSHCTNLSSIVVPPSVLVIGDFVWDFCPVLREAYFLGNPPSGGDGAFNSAKVATVYYMPGTTGWGSTFAGRPTVLWGPKAAGKIPEPGNAFSITITGNDGLLVVIEVSPNLENPVWTPIGTNVLTGGIAHFSDADSPKFPRRFYRMRPNFGEAPLVWNARPIFPDGQTIMDSNVFGFPITGNDGLVVIVEAASSLSAANWTAVSTNTLFGGISYFSDPQWTNSSSRIYRLRAP